MTRQGGAHRPVHVLDAPLALLIVLVWQVRTGAYDLDANLALLRHYNFSPEKTNVSTVAKILIKAQMRLPEHDFSQMLHLIPERRQVPCLRFRILAAGCCGPAVWDMHGPFHAYKGKPRLLTQEEQPVAALIALTQHLEGARFQQYWQAAEACKDVVGTVPGYYDAVRSYITTAITSTCQKASKAMMAESLRLDGPKLDELVSAALSHGIAAVTTHACQRG